MAAHGGASRAVDDDDWLSADQIAALAGGRVKPNTVRTWWRQGLLEFRAFPELGAKSNKRSRRGTVAEFLGKKLGAIHLADDSPAPPQSVRDAQVRREPRVRDLQDTLASLKASMDAAMEALIIEAEQNAAVMAAHAEVSLAQAKLDRARADADARRVEMLRHLHTVVRGYDMALSTYLQSDTPQDLLS
jgi:hypothetical protein